MPARKPLGELYVPPGVINAPLTEAQRAALAPLYEAWRAAAPGREADAAYGRYMEAAARQVGA